MCEAHHMVSPASIRRTDYMFFFTCLKAIKPTQGAAVCCVLRVICEMLPRAAAHARHQLAVI